MPRTILPPDKPLPPEIAPNRKRWTRRDCAFLVENGILTGRYELIDGEVISKMGQNPPHAYVVKALLAWLIRLFGVEHVQGQLPVDVAHADPEINEPEPDAAVTALTYREYTVRHPCPADLLLVVEVSDSTVQFDLRNKSTLYARAGITEYWVVDLVKRRLVVHRLPEANRYRDVTEYLEAERVAPLARPDAEVRVGDLLPPVQL